MEEKGTFSKKALHTETYNNVWFIICNSKIFVGKNKKYGKKVKNPLPIITFSCSLEVGETSKQEA